MEANEEQRQEECMVTHTENLRFINKPLNLMGSWVVQSGGEEVALKTGGTVAVTASDLSTSYPHEPCI